MLRRAYCSVTLAALALLLGAGTLHAQNSHFGWNAMLGYSTFSGDIGELLNDGYVGELNFFWQSSGALRVGLATSAISYTMQEPLQNDSWTSITVAAFGSWVFLREKRLHPYLQARIGYVRLTPDKLDEEGERLPFVDRADGFDLGLTGGGEYMFSPHWGLDLSLKYGYDSVSDMLTADPELPEGITIENGQTWTLRLGLVMHF